MVHMQIKTVIKAIFPLSSDPADTLVCLLDSTYYHKIGDKACFVSVKKFALQTNIDLQVRQINPCAKIVLQKNIVQSIYQIKLICSPVHKH